ncbi:(2Fe-2S)-binding protein [Mesorhizobium sp. J428]|uniref:(2Fe-2S)-binding protein n=1 Tax=Mesorhizobium sp. J428 TaxID=2898440 RepID=UPI002151F692|nr:(2Fe-2S)-binding protein [Mesorhizobium sp. J428]MCR5856213.1 (2Fe-2S)-binding protein [Mesorhizobium sp. J428]
MNVAFRLNGEARQVSASADRRLIDLLRDDLGLTAAKKACGIGRCGSCMVLLDGQPANSCLLMLWQLDGRDVVTPEGLDALPEARTVRAELAVENAFQCGYCAPGFSMTLTALLRESPQAGETEIRAALEGNICRCTGYHSILRGALAAAEALRRARSPTGDRQ